MNTIEPNPPERILAHFIHVGYCHYRCKSCGQEFHNTSWGRGLVPHINSKRCRMRRYENELAEAKKAALVLSTTT